MKKKIMKNFKGLITLAIMFCLSNVYSQTKYTGYFCTGATAYDLTSFKYTREYKTEGDGVFVTLYKIYSTTEGYYLNIKATHYKSEKKIVVEIDDITVSKKFGHISTQTITYEEPSMKMFGYANAMAAAGMDAQGRLPNDLAIKFVSTKYENVKVVQIQKDSNLNAMKWYILDEKN